VAQEIRNRWGNVTPHRLMPGQVLKLLDDWRAHYAPGSVWIHRNTLKRMFTFIDRTHRTYLAEMVLKIPAPAQRHITATTQEVSTLLTLAPIWLRALILFARGMGMRRGEILDLRPKHFDETTQGLNFPRKLGGTSGLPVPPALQALIRFAAEQDPNERILLTLGMRVPTEHPQRQQGKSSPDLRQRAAMHNYVTHHWNKLLKKAGITRQLHIHDLRHTAATEAFGHTRDLRTVQQRLGHRSMSSTLRYIAPLATAELRAALGTLNHEWLYRAKPQTEIKQ
jgi:integrase